MIDNANQIVNGLGAALARLAGVNAVRAHVESLDVIVDIRLDLVARRHRVLEVLGRFVLEAFNVEDQNARQLVQ